jgi:hypothetical protein
VAGNVNITRTGPEAMVDNPPANARRENADRATDYRLAGKPPIDFRVVAAHYIGVAVLTLLLAVLYGAFRAVLCWGSYSATCVSWRSAETAAPWALAAGAGVFLLARFVIWWQAARVKVAQARIENQRLSLLPDRFGNPTPAGLYDGLEPRERMHAYMQMLQLATELKATTAPHETIPSGVNVLTMQNTTNPAALLEAAEQAPDVGPLAPAVWLGWLDRQPHALFAARTGDGKSTIARYGLKPRIEAGEEVFVIDPHSNGWFSLPAVGGGENWREIEAAMMCVYAEYKNRLNERERYKRETGEELDQHHFPRLTVVFDEANNARSAFERIYAGSKRRHDPWPLFAECLGSGARKVGISIWSLAQSALVEDLGLTGAMRQNFTRIALDLYTIRQMTDREESDKTRKEAIYAALPAQYPATANVENKVFLLDRVGIHEIAPPRNSAGAAWSGWDYGARRPIVTLAAPDEDDSADVLAGLMARPLRYATLNGNGYVATAEPPARSVAERSAPVDTREALVKQMRRQRDSRGKSALSQDAIRAALAAMGHEIAQELLVRWCQEVDGE